MQDVPRKRALNVTYCYNGQRPLPQASVMIPWNGDYEEVLETSKRILKRHISESSEGWKWWLATPNWDDTKNLAEIVPEAFAAVVEQDRVKLFLCGAPVDSGVVLHPPRCRLNREQYYNFGIAVIGGTKVGKTLFLRRFSGQLTSNLGLYGIQSVNRFTAPDENLPIRLSINDPISSECLTTSAVSIFHRREGLFLIYDITRPDSLDECQVWLDKAREYVIPGTPVLLVGNQLDRPNDRRVTLREVEHFRAENGIFDTIETSSITGHNIELAFQTLVQEMFSQLQHRGSLTRYKRPLSSKTPRTTTIPFRQRVWRHVLGLNLYVFWGFCFFMTVCLIYFCMYLVDLES